MEAGAVVAVGLALVGTGQRWGQNSMGHFYRFIVHVFHD